MPSVKSLLRPLPLSAVALLLCVAGGAATSGAAWQRLAVIVLAPLLLAVHGLQSNKLTRGGACMSAAVGWLLLAAGPKYFCTVISFYALGNAATKFRAAAKMGMVSEGGGQQAYGQRGAQQVAIKGEA